MQVLVGVHKLGYHVGVLHPPAILLIPNRKDTVLADIIKVS